MGAEVIRKIVLRNKHGLHARPATAFVQTAQRFTSDISVLSETDEVDGKSIISILTLGLGPGATISIRAVGNDAEQAIEALIQLMETSESFD